MTANGAATIGITGATCCRIICRSCDGLERPEQIGKRESAVGNSSPRAHVEQWRRAHRNPARLFDQMHPPSDVREEQYAMVCAPAHTPGNPGCLRSFPTRRLVFELCPLELSC